MQQENDADDTESEDKRQHDDADEDEDEQQAQQAAQQDAQQQQTRAQSASARAAEFQRAGKLPETGKRKPSPGPDEPQAKRSRPDSPTRRARSKLPWRW